MSEPEATDDLSQEALYTFSEFCQKMLVKYPGDSNVLYRVFTEGGAKDRVPVFEELERRRVITKYKMKKYKVADINPIKSVVVTLYLAPRGTDLRYYFMSMASL